MKTSAQLRLVRLSGLLLLSLLVVALAVSSAQAAGSGGNSSQQLTLAQVLQRHTAGATTGTAAFAAAQAGTLERGGVTLAVLTPARAGTQGRGGTAAFAAAQAGTQGRGGIGPLAQTAWRSPASTSSPSGTTWIAIGSAVAVLIVGLTAWVLIRRRRSPQLASASYCAQHPQDPLCAGA